MVLQPFAIKMDSVDVRQLAWRISRKLNPWDEIDMSQLEYADFALSDCKFVFLHIRSSILFRELLMSATPLSVWSRSSRVDRISDTAMSSEYAYNDWAVRSFKSKLYMAEKSGKPQDIARCEIPLTASSDYVVGANWRTWISFLKALEDHGSEIGAKYLKIIKGALSIKDLSSYKYGSMLESVSISEDDMKEGCKSMSMMGYTAMSFDTTFTHASHFARHMHNKFKSSVWDLASQKMDDHHEMNLLTKVRVLTLMPTPSYKKILSHRSDWLADHNVWSSFVSIGHGPEGLTPQQFQDSLEEVGNYSADNMARIALTDPNIPDPRMLECPALVHKRWCMEGDNYIIRQWIAMADAGLIKDNPDNEYRKQYEQNLINNGQADFIDWN